MAHGDFSPISYPNTFRDSNDVPDSTTDLIAASALDYEPMEYESGYGNSVTLPNNSDHAVARRNQVSRQNHLYNNPLVKTVTRPTDNFSEDLSVSQERPNLNGNSSNENNLLSEATGYDSARAADIDADAAFARQLQQEEYERGSFLPREYHQFFPFRIRTDDESSARRSSPDTPAHDPALVADEQMAALLQRQEYGSNQNNRRRQTPFGPSIFHSGLVVTEHMNEPNPPQIVEFPRFAASPANDDDHSDDDEHIMGIQPPFLQFFASRGQPVPRSVRPLFSNFHRHGFRRSGNLQDTTDDFGPEDYERLLQLDDTIKKKKLTQSQINTVKSESFAFQTNQSDENHKCSVCLELFEPNQMVRRFPCQHIYHKDCADRWLRENNVCPICRKPPVTEQTGSHARSRHQNRPMISNRSHGNRNNTSNSNNNNNNGQNHQQQQHPSHYRRGGPFHRQS